MLINPDGATAQIQGAIVMGLSSTLIEEVSIEDNELTAENFNRYPILMAQLEWMQSMQGKDGKWNLPTKLINDNSRWTNLLRVEKDWRSPTRKEADMTFRMLLIMRHQWERQIRMLDRRDDAYPI